MDQNAELRAQLTEQYRKKNFVFVPNGDLPTYNGLFIPTSTRVLINSDDFYKVQFKFGLKHFAFMKIADAAGIKWSSDGVNVGRMDNRSNPDFCSFRVVGKIRTPDGLESEFAASKHLDLKAKESGMVAKHETDFDYKLKFGGGKGPNGYAVKKPWPTDKTEYVKKFVDRDLGQLRENMDERCESGAQSRVVKNLMHIPANFDNNNGREFHIVRYILDPRNELVQKAQLSCLGMSLVSIYGPGAAPQIQPPPAIRNITPKDENNTQKHENFTPKAENETIDSSLIDFENSGHGDQVKIIEGIVKKYNYDQSHHIKDNGELILWSNAHLKEYFQYLIKEVVKR